MSLEELMQVDITGSTLTPEKLSKVPSAVTVFTYQQIQQMGLDNLDELVNLVPGFQSYRVTRSPIGYPISSRGRRVSNASAEILILVDGQRKNDPRTSGTAIVTPKLPLMNIERVEFIRGPGAAIYGSNAMLGVINIITRSDVNEVSVGLGSFNRRQAYFLASQKSGELTADVFMNINTDEGDNYLLPDTFSINPINTDDPRQLFDFSIKLGWQNTQLNIQHNRAMAKNFYEQNAISNGFNRRRVDISSISLKQDFSWQSISSYVHLSYSASNFSTFDQFTPAGALFATSLPASNDPLLVIGKSDGPSESRMLWHNDWQINDRSSLQFGFEWRYLNIPEMIMFNNFDFRDIANGVTPVRYYGALLPTTPIQTKSRRDITGIYAQYQHQLFDDTQLTLGIRYDHFSDIGEEVSPRLGLVQTLNKHHSLKLLYGEAFRAPSENELNLVNNPVTLGNPGLMPETVQSLDLIWLGQWTHTSFSLGLFESRYDNSIIQADAGGGTFQFTNADQKDSGGMEFEISHELSNHWLLRANYTRLNKKSDLSFREADQLMSLMLNYQREKWNANLIGTYHDERITLTGGNSNIPLMLDDYWQLNGKFIYNVTQNLQAFLQAKNLLDENYQTSTTSNKLTQGTANRGREMLAGVVWKF